MIDFVPLTKAAVKGRLAIEKYFESISKCMPMLYSVWTDAKKSVEIIEEFSGNVGKFANLLNVTHRDDGKSGITDVWVKKIEFSNECYELVRKKLDGMD